MSLDLESIRAQFPVLHQAGTNGSPLVYLDNAASSQKPSAVIDAISAYYEHDHANVHRGVHLLSRRATEAFELGRSRVARFIGAASPEQLVFTRGTTESLNLVASAWGSMLGEGDEIVLTELEHHSNIVPWQMVAARTGAVIRVIPLLDDGSLDLDAYAALLCERTRVVSVAHVSNALGTVNDVVTITEQAHKYGALVVVDGAQAAPHGSVDVGALGCDFYALSAHKMYGPTGIGALWGRAELLEQMPPWQGGGEMIETVSFQGSTWAPPPAKFEAGTPNIAGAVGFGVAAEWMAELGPQAIAAHEQVLLDRATARVAEIDGVRIIGTAPHKAGVLSFVAKGLHPHDIGTLLDEQGIAVRTGHHCAQPVMERMGVDATARASFAVYNTVDEVDRFAKALARIISLFG